MKRFAYAVLSSVALAAPAAFADKGHDHDKHGSKAAPADGLTAGVVKKIDKDAGKITIAHEANESLGMPKMTMVFRAKEPGMLDAVKEGDKVNFAARQGSGSVHGDENRNGEMKNLVHVQSSRIGQVAIRLLVASAAAVAFSALAAPVLHHVHGLGFSADGKGVVVPSHFGLDTYRDGNWSRVHGPLHDFKGFASTAEAFYASGHPVPQARLPDPMGLAKSTDGGRTWRLLGLAGEADFHIVAAGYRSKAVYVVNSAPNSKMPQPGLYVTFDDGKSWLRAAGRGLAGRIQSLAVHPDDRAIVVAGTAAGLFVSRDAGEHFRSIARGRTVSAAAVSMDGDRVYFVYEYTGRLLGVPLKGGPPFAITLPPLMSDSVAYVALSPTALNTIAVATRKRNVYLSTDAGSNWEQIAKEGDDNVTNENDDKREPR